MMHCRRKIQTTREMDEVLRSQVVEHTVMTVVKNATSTCSYSERFIPGSQNNCQNQEINGTVEPYTGRNNLCYHDTENSHGLSTDLCQRSSTANTNRISDEIQQSTEIIHEDIPQDMTLKIREEEEKIRKSVVVCGTGPPPESHPETSFPVDTPLRDLTSDEETARKAREEGRVDVVFPGSVTQDGCCRFVCELLKCVLYQRQQLPMTYDQMVLFQKQQHASTQPEDTVARIPAKPPAGVNWHRGKRTLQELDEVLIHLGSLFSLSHVPRVLFMLGGSVLLPVELYEVNMEAVVVRGGDGSLRTSSCLRQLFRKLFVADLLSDVKPVRLLATTIMALAHRDCGVTWFKPKLDFKVPARVKRQVVSLACEMPQSRLAVAGNTAWDNYIWFQAPVTIKGFCK